MADDTRASPRRRILVVDDDPDVLQSTELLLGVMGFDAVPLADARRILDVAVRERPDLILQDLRMPHFDLEATVQGLRADPATRGIPIVFFSADPEASEKAAEHDVSGVLAKPFQHRELEAVLKRAFGEPYVASAWPGAPTPAREVVDVFHELWNEMAAVNNYLGVLEHRLADRTPERVVAREIEMCVLRLAHLFDELQRAHQVRLPVAPLPARGSVEPS